MSSHDLVRAWNELHMTIQFSIPKGTLATYSLLHTKAMREL